MAKEVNGSKEVDEYISAQPPETRRALEVLRSCIRQAAPGAVELMNYGIPAFALVKNGKRDQQVMIAGFKKHTGFYPHPDVIEVFADQIAQYNFAKGSIQFPLDKPIPEKLVKSMVKCRITQLRKTAAQ